MSVDIATLASREDVKTIAFHHLALETIQSMCTHNQLVARDFGTDSPEYIKQVTSFSHVMSSLLNSGFGNSTFVTKDGDKSLFVQEGGKDGSSNYVFGVIFFRDRAYDGRTDVVQPGDWSVHS